MVLSRDFIIDTITKQFSGLKVDRNWGEIGLFYNPDNLLKKGIYLLTFKEKNGANDQSSNLDRDGFYRLNLGISKKSFIELFGSIPKRPPAGGVIDMNFDFSQTDTIVPHPIYGWMAWICVVNPTEISFKKILPLIEEGYNLSLKKYSKKITKD